MIPFPPQKVELACTHFMVQGRDASHSLVQTCPRRGRAGVQLGAAARHAERQRLVATSASAVATTSADNARTVADLAAAPQGVS